MAAPATQAACTVSATPATHGCVMLEVHTSNGDLVVSLALTIDQAGAIAKAICEAANKSFERAGFGECQGHA